MADASVDLLLNELKDLLIYHSHLIQSSKIQIEDLERNLRLFKAFLKDSVKRRRKDEDIQMVRRIRDVVYEAEDTIDSLVTQLIERKSKSYFLRAFTTPVTLNSICNKVKELITLLDYRAMDFRLSLAEEDRSENSEIRLPRYKDVVGFVDVREELVSRLTKETDYFDVISLIGMFGLGKTTLAWNIFNDPDIEYMFPVRIWLTISQEFSMKNIFLEILKNMITKTDEVYHKDEQELAGMVAKYLDRGRFLIVMDDVWNDNDWSKLSIVLPKNNYKGKVLITSRNKNVGVRASQPRAPCNLRLFSLDESWELLQLEALPKMHCPSELVTVGKQIAGDCNGLPLALVVIGGILATKFSASGITAIREQWEKVCAHVSDYLNKDREDRMNKSIYLSYDTLPDHLRRCFLYLGMFRNDREISVSQLMCMWIAEGFIQQLDTYSLEETAEMYLEDLINRNLVIVEKFRPNGKVKTCRVHYILSEFCKSEASCEKENFLQEIKSNNGVFEPPISHLHEFRRLSIHSNCLDFISSVMSVPSGLRARSFVCFSDEFILPLQYTAAIPAAFKLLKVLDVKPIKFERIPSNMYKLVHVRYIALSLNLGVLPFGFSKLWNIQTLIVDTTSRTLKVQADLCKMNQLRHFKTNASAALSRPSTKGQYGEELQTLSTISVESCTAKLFDEACNLKKLGIRGKLALLFDEKIGSFDNLGKLRYLENLKLKNDVFPLPPLDGKLGGLPQPYRFPSRLRSLTLVATYLSWSCMSNLGLLEHLKILKLKENAFWGSTWKAVVGGFRHLEFLHIEGTDLVSWEASSYDFPRLRSLVLRNCENLLYIPIELAEIPSLQTLDLYLCRRAAASAKNIQEAKKMKQAEGYTFNLSIFPPI